MNTEWQPFEDRAGLAVAIRVPRSSELHTLADGRVLIRSHAGNQPLDGPKVSQLAATKASGDFEVETVAGASRADLDEEVIEDYLQRRTARLGRDLGHAPAHGAHDRPRLATRSALLWLWVVLPASGATPW